LDKPIVAFGHRPIEEGSGSSPVSIYERVNPAHHEVNDNRLDERMYEWHFVCVIGKFTKLLHARHDLVCRRRHMEFFMISLVDDTHILVESPPSTSCTFIVKGRICHY